MITKVITNVVAKVVTIVVAMVTDLWFAVLLGWDWLHTDGGCPRGGVAKVLEQGRYKVILPQVPVGRHDEGSDHRVSHANRETLSYYSNTLSRNACCKGVINDI